MRRWREATVIPGAIWIAGLDAYHGLVVMAGRSRPGSLHWGEAALGTHIVLLVFTVQS